MDIALTQHTRNMTQERFRHSPNYKKKVVSQGACIVSRGLQKERTLTQVSVGQANELFQPQTRFFFLCGISFILYFKKK